jgi:hypothetical protein
MTRAAMRRSSLLRLLGAVAAVLIITGFAAFSRQNSSDAAPLRVCGQQHASVAAPGELPSSYPLPQNTIITRVQRVRGVVVVTGIQPLAIREAGRFLITALPKAGYRLGRGDSEAGEAETDFLGHGAVGRVKVRTIPGCAHATHLVIALVQRSR